MSTYKDKGFPGEERAFLGGYISPLEQVAAELGRNFAWTGRDMVGDRSENSVKGCLPERDTTLQDSSDLKWFLVGNGNLEEGLKLPKH
jgi:hypothetical protein